MKLSLLSIFEVARWKAEGVKSEDSFSFINSLVDKGYYITYTNSPNKIGFNPSFTAQDIGNPKGFYGFPIDKKFIEYLPYVYLANRRFIIIWKPKEGLNIINWSDVLKTIKDFKREGAYLTNKLMKMGYDGVLSSDRAMSGDIDSELVVFKPSDVEVVNIMKNTLLHDYEAFKNSLEVQKLERTKNRLAAKNSPRDIWRDSDEQALKRWQRQEKYYRNNSRRDRKNISI